VEDSGIPELTSEQIEEVCSIAEEAARKHVHSKVTKKDIETLNIIAEVEGTKPVNLTVDVDLDLSPKMKSFDAQKLADEAVKEAFKSAEKYLRELACHSTK
jgi:histone H3/H4